MQDIPIKVLIIEDDEDDYILVRTLLLEVSSCRYEIDWVSGYQAALDEMKLCRHSVYLLDYRLGTDSGLELLGKSKGCNSPTILLTGYDNRALDVAAMEAGAVDFLLKEHITSDMLERSIRYAINQKKTQEDLRESEARFRQMFEKSHAAKLLIDPERIEIVDANPAACKFYGYRRNELLGMELSRINTLSSDEIGKKLAQALAEERNHFYFKHRLASGEIRDVETYSNPISFRGKRLLFSIIHDVTERRRAEEELYIRATHLEEINTQLAKALEELSIQEEELFEQNENLVKAFREIELQRQRYIELFQFAPDGYVVTDPKGFIREANMAAELLLGLDQEMLAGKSIALFVPKEDRARFRSHIYRLRMLQGTKSWVTRLTHSKGLFHAEVSVTALHPPLSDTAGLRWTIRDISKRKEIEDQVRLERERFFSLLETLPAYVLLLAPDHSIRFANSYFRDRFNEWGAKRGYEVFPGCIEPCNGCPVMEVLRTGRSQNWQWTHSTTGKTYEIYGYPFTDMDGSPLVLELGIDITQSKRAQEAARQSKEALKHLSSRLLSVQEEERARIAKELHDSIGQSLAALKFTIENVLVADQGGDTRIDSNLLEHLVPMVQNTIAETRRIYMSLRPTVLDDLGIIAAIEWFCREFRQLHPKSRIERKIAIEEAKVPQNLKIVIFRIIQEALVNAARHSKASQISLSLLGEDNSIQLSIRDNGDGFDMESILTGSSRIQGLGIASMRERTELSGGTFSIESIIGDGTRIRASWPRGNEE